MELLANNTFQRLADEIAACDKAGKHAELPASKVLQLFNEVKFAVISQAVLCLGAGRKRWDKDAANGCGDWAVEVDYATRLKAVELLWDRLEGRPAQTVLNLNADMGGGKLNSAELFAGDPKAEELLLELVAKVRAARVGKGGGNPKKMVSVSADKAS